MRIRLAHEPARRHAGAAMLDRLSNDKQVTKNTPPTFMFHTDDDAGVPPENSVTFYLALKRAGVPAELHVYQHGRHGVGLAPKIPCCRHGRPGSRIGCVCAVWFRRRGPHRQHQRRRSRTARRYGRLYCVFSSLVASLRAPPQIHRGATRGSSASRRWKYLPPRARRLTPILATCSIPSGAATPSRGASAA